MRTTKVYCQDAPSFGSIIYTLPRCTTFWHVDTYIVYSVHRKVEIIIISWSIYNIDYLNQRAQYHFHQNNIEFYMSEKLNWVEIKFMTVQLYERYNYTVLVKWWSRGYFLVLEKTYNLHFNKWHYNIKCCIYWIIIKLIFIINFDHIYHWYYIHIHLLWS